MEGRSPALGRAGFSRGRLVFGVVLVTLVAAGGVAGVGRLARPPLRLVFAQRSRVLVGDLRSGRVRAVARLPAAPYPVLPSPGGRWLAYGAPRPERYEAFVLDVRSGRRRPVPGQPVGWTPDDHLLLRRDGRLEVEGEPGRVLLPGSARPWRVLWVGPRTLAVQAPRPGTGDLDLGEMQIVHLGERGPRTVHTVERARPLAATPDGRDLLYVVYEPLSDVFVERVRVLDLRTLRSRDPGFGGSIVGVARGPKGIAAVANVDGASWGVYLVHTRPWRLERLAGEALGSVAWLPDGSVAFGAPDGVRRVDSSGRVRTVFRARFPVVLGAWR